MSPPDDESSDSSNLSIEEIHGSFGLSVNNNKRKRDGEECPLKTTKFEGSMYSLQEVPSSRKSKWVRPFHQDADDKSFFVCNRCGKRIKSPGGNTSAFKQHLQRCKNDPDYKTFKYLAASEAYNPANFRTSSSSTSKDNKRLKQNKMNTYFHSQNLSDKHTRKKYVVENISRWIVEEMLPISSVESTTFRNVCNAFHECGYVLGTGTQPKKSANGSPSQNPPVVSGKAVDEWIIKKVGEVRKGLREICKSQILSTTVDHWTSRGKHNYTGMTAHWIDEQFQFHSVDLGCWLHEGKSDAKNILRDFMEKFVDTLEFDESTTMFSVTSDTTGNMNSFGRNLAKDKNVHHLYCTDHNIQLTAKEAFDDNYHKDLNEDERHDHVLQDYEVGFEDSERNVLERLRDLVTHFNKSTQAVEDLKKIQQTLQPKVQPKVLIQDVVTRWWSTYRTIARALQLKEPLDIMAKHEKIPHEKCLTEEEWKCLKEIGSVLEPFASAQKMLEGDKYVTSSLVCPVIFFLRKEMRELCTNNMATAESEYMAKNLAQRLLNDLEKRWGKSEDQAFHAEVQYGSLNRQVGIHKVFCLASLLDPRFKKLAFLEHEGDEPSIWSELEKEMKKVVDEGTFDFNHRAADEVISIHDDDESKSGEDEGSDILDRYMGSIAEKNQTNTTISPEEMIGRELEEYKKEPALTPKTKGKKNCPLEWWKNHQERFPILSRLARIYLAVQATSAPSERVFSKAERVISKKRTRLNPVRAGSLIWLGAILKQKKSLSIPSASLEE